MSLRKKIRVPLTLVVVGVGAVAIGACASEVCKVGDPCATGGAGGTGATGQTVSTTNQTSSPAG